MAFSFAGHKYLVYQHKLSSARKLQHVTKDVFKIVVANAKQQCEGAMVSLIKELEKHFPKHQVMMTLGVISPPLWSRNLKHAKGGIPWVANGVEGHLLNPLQCG